MHQNPARWHWNWETFPMKASNIRGSAYKVHICTGHSCTVSRPWLIPAGILLLSTLMLQAFFSWSSRMRAEKLNTLRSYLSPHCTGLGSERGPPAAEERASSRKRIGCFHVMTSPLTSCHPNVMVIFWKSVIVPCFLNIKKLLYKNNIVFFSEENNDFIHLRASNSRIY